MPTGYTAEIYEGKDVKFKDFAMDCARSFGAFASLRDTPEVELPESIQLDVSFYEKIIEDSRKKIVDMENLSDEEISAIIKKSRKERISGLEKEIEDKKTVLKKYESMLNEAKNWNPPSKEHFNLKEFMIEQLETSMRYDCNVEGPEGELKRVLNSAPQSVEEYRKNVASSAEDDIEYYTEKIHKSISKNYDTNLWIKQLRESFNNS